MRIIIIAGPNGAGKTTFAMEYLSREAGNPLFVNGDDIAAQLNPAEPAAAAYQAARMALERIDGLVSRGRDFVIETTLSGRAYVTRIRRWQALGYRVAIIYLRLSSADLAVERVARRVGEGGHSVPEKVIRRRFERGWSNFLELYRHVADEWRVYENSGQIPVLLAQSEGRPGVREPRPAWHPQYSETERNLVMENAGRIPEGEPSNESVLAALVRARDRALARAAAVLDSQACDNSARGHGKGGMAPSAKRSGRRKATGRHIDE